MGLPTPAGEDARLARLKTTGSVPLETLEAQVLALTTQSSIPGRTTEKLSRM